MGNAQVQGQFTNCPCLHFTIYKILMDFDSDLFAGFAGF